MESEGGQDFPITATDAWINLGIPAAVIVVTVTTVGLLMGSKLSFVLGLIAGAGAGGTLTHLYKPQIKAKALIIRGKYVEAKNQTASIADNNDSSPTEETQSSREWSIDGLLIMVDKAKSAAIRVAATKPDTAIGLSIWAGYTVTLTAFVVGYFAMPRLVAFASGVTAGATIGVAGAFGAQYLPSIQGGGEHSEQHQYSEGGW